MCVAVTSTTYYQAVRPRRNQHQPWCKSISYNVYHCYHELHIYNVSISRKADNLVLCVISIVYQGFQIGGKRMISTGM